MLETTLSLFSALFLLVSDDPPSIEYPGSRSSSRWVTTPDGIQVAVDRGVEWQGVTVYLSLTWNLIAVDSETKKARWSHSVSAFWNKLGFAEVEVEPGKKDWCVELSPSSRTRLGADQREYRSLSTGRKITPVGARKEQPGVELSVPHWTQPECKIAKSARFFVSTPEHWASVRQRLGISAEPDGFDHVDFEQNMLLVCCLGRVSNCRGVMPSDARDIDGTLRIRLHHHTFRTAGGGVHHHPWGVMVLPRHQGPVRLERNAQGMLHGPPLWKELQTWDAPPPVDEELAPLPRRRRDI